MDCLIRDQSLWGFDPSSVLIESAQSQADVLNTEEPTLTALCFPSRLPTWAGAWARKMAGRLPGWLPVPLETLVIAPQWASSKRKSLDAFLSHRENVTPLVAYYDYCCSCCSASTGMSLHHPSLWTGFFTFSWGNGRGKTYQLPRSWVKAASSRKTCLSVYVNWSSQLTSAFIYRICQLCVTNFAQSHYLKQFVSMWEATPSPSWKVSGENVIIHHASAWVIKRSQEFKREK